jgi:hypothetical protein
MWQVTAQELVYGKMRANITKFYLEGSFFSPKRGDGFQVQVCRGDSIISARAGFPTIEEAQRWAEYEMAGIMVAVAPIES